MEALDWLRWHFTVSGVETYWFLPPLVMLCISSLTSLGGVSGAFILLPFQMSVLGYTAPGVSATNFVYNIVSIPVGVLRHIRSGRLCWPLFWLLMGSTLPGVFLGYYIRLVYLPQPGRFKIFVGVVLAYLGLRTLWSACQEARDGNTAPKAPPSGRITGGTISLTRGTVVFGEQTYSYPTVPLAVISLAVGVIGGAYGIGGGALMAPFIISVLNLPPYVVSGATLFSTWCTSVVAALFYAFGPTFGTQGSTSPDWLLGSLFGAGGLLGIYLGARLQQFVPALVIKIILAAAVIFVAFRYLYPLVSG
ncbi:hypothetical protein SAMN02746041_00157 [Desulfacinum hydrothermale DSM 13146]|uniref:Probable membrane transporter protein n=1 Tax=Desulfacinum hydrothermale DSM 13146 TaxID=1121390 RepID=A0A1W1WYF9_9BACT|nr:sulfite exporter TauE/SafE family protein [Desulfacinum hydrothermale]SMC16752.1 hypothetical protein SAMN02746041_00157 [Desulfacinum hydrothermale DSM 13146]